LYDDSCVVEQFENTTITNADGTHPTARAYGRIINIYSQSLPCLPELGSQIFIECLWYEHVQNNAITGLTQIQSFDDNPWKYVLLKNMYRQDCVFWPSDGRQDVDYEDKSIVFDVILHTDSIGSEKTSAIGE